MRRTGPSNRPRSGRTALVSALVLLVVIIGLGVAVAVARDGRTESGPVLCAGVAWVGAPVAASSSEAFAAWLAENPDEPPIEAWERRHPIFRPVSGRRSVSYETTERRLVWRVTVGTGGTDEDGGPVGLDEWRVDGACAGTRRTLGD